MVIRFAIAAAITAATFGATLAPWAWPIAALIAARHARSPTPREEEAKEWASCVEQCLKGCVGSVPVPEAPKPSPVEDPPAQPAADPPSEPTEPAEEPPAQPTSPPDDPSPEPVEDGEDGAIEKSALGALAASLDGTAWRFVEVACRALPDAIEATLVFDAGRAAGSSGCNRFAAAFETTGDRIAVSELISTRWRAPTCEWRSRWPCRRRCGTHGGSASTPTRWSCRPKTAASSRGWRARPIRRRPSTQCRPRLDRDARRTARRRRPPPAPCPTGRCVWTRPPRPSARTSLRSDRPRIAEMPTGLISGDAPGRRASAAGGRACGCGKRPAYAFGSRGAASQRLKAAAR